MQDEVEKTLSDLLTQMEPWSSAREVKGEAGRLLQEQRKLQAQTAELDKKLRPAVKPASCRRRSQDQLRDLADSQRRLEERTNELLGKINRMAEARPKTPREHTVPERSPR